MPAARLQIEPCSVSTAVRLERELGVSAVMAQVLVRRGLADPALADAFLNSDQSHEPAAFARIDRAVEVILEHAAAGSQITIHGDYDVDGVCSTAVLVRALRGLGATVDWYLPDRARDGYGLGRATVERLAQRGTRLLITADCAITAVEEIACARELGLDVVVTDHHAPRADGVLPQAPIVHPVVCGYPCPDLCATAVAYKLALALHRARGRDERHVVEDLDLVALATVADVVPLTGENRTLVRRGLRALATTAKPGLRALMAIARVEPGRVDERALGFGLAPRLNAAGRLYRADAGLELVLTEDPQRAAQVADELDHANHERRHAETRILFEAEAQVAELGDRPAYVLAGEGWHPGVIGIVASRIAERHHRPTLVIALEGDRGRGSGRSIAPFDLLDGLRACDGHLLRYGGHRAAAGLEIERARVPDLADAFTAYARDTLRPDDLVPVERVDAVVAGDELGMTLAEELARLAPFGRGNPAVSLLLPAAALRDPRPMGEGRHVRFTVEAGGARSRAVGFGTGGRLPVDADTPADATFTLELNEYNGAVEPRLVLRNARPCEPAPIELIGEAAGFLEGVWAELDAPLAGQQLPPEPARGVVHDRRGRGIAGTLGALAASGEPLLVVCADAQRRREHLAGRLGGFALCSYAALVRRPALAERYRQVALLDPPASAQAQQLTRPRHTEQHVHLAWGEPEQRFALRVHERDCNLRGELAALYRALRSATAADGELSLAGSGEHVLRGELRARPPLLAGRLLRVLSELELVELDRARAVVRLRDQARTSLERSPAFRVYSQLLEEGRRLLAVRESRVA